MSEQNVVKLGLIQGSDAPLLDPKAPLASAREFIDRIYTLADVRTLHHHGGNFYAWTGSHYPEADTTKLRADLYAFLETARRTITDGKTAPFNPNRAKIGDIIDALAAVTNLSTSVQPPAWLGEAADLEPNQIIACANGLLHMPSLTLLTHTPEFFTQNALDFDFQPAATQPLEWLKFLGDLWPNDQEAIATLQELFGYLLTADTRQQKAFLIVGPKRSGKGTVARILSRLIGQENVCGPVLAALGQNFGLEPLIGKRLAIISDARLGNRADQHAIAERLLAISGEDAITIDRKHRQAWTGRLATRFLILSNELPRLADASGALASRFIVLTLSTSFFGREDHGLTDRLARELPAILNWSIAGWLRLNERGYFRPPASSLDVVRELEDLGSPISAFVRDMCEFGPAKRVEIGFLFEAWVGWCKTQGRDHPGTTAVFGRDLRAAVSGLRVSQPRADGSRIRFYEGIGLK